MREAYGFGWAGTDKFRQYLTCCCWLGGIARGGCDVGRDYVSRTLLIFRGNLQLVYRLLY
jgi:hypothetical protein